ncbi:PREDICTED: DNA-directed RNA polymerase V subunit 7-like [Nicotiana attenuata]|uniref:DNA-directed RNA polymerase subunit n=1 Tax=Nicotiana attenuata TaxID=49451 RepID=A0A1J6IUP3_NICAT|nr:PREDICTED: DNA-directed RNA polymerase V subunit 7-like [Nicotiana attenuata]XP_019253617.1 PREDICTED: DNA-directed RNA polymerase V subunit 7-like [Nicotiana attenuata]OIS98856.1 dna-directed rna polymerase v subunit 7 [Nicotiana attenuata]
MLCDLEILFYVVVPMKDIKESGQVPGSVVIKHLLDHLACVRVTEDCGYFLRITKVKSIGNGKMYQEKLNNGKLMELSEYIIFPVTFCFRSFLPKTGEVLVGIVIKVVSNGVFLKCGPMKFVYLSVRKMPNYTYVSGEKPFFLCDDHSRIENEVAVRFVVFAVRWNNGAVARDFNILASIEGDCLGPISLNGLDGLEL